MENFIHHKKIAYLLNEIDSYLGYHIQAIPMHPLESAYRQCGVQLVDGKWTFQYVPGDIPSQDIICHELMHIVLSIQGWPVIAARTGLPSPVHTVLGLLAPIGEHTCIYGMVSALGYNPIPNDAGSTPKDLIHSMIGQQLVAAFAPVQRPYAGAIFLCEALLSPHSEEDFDNIILSAQKWMPESYLMAIRMASIYKNNFPITPDNHISTLREAMGVVALPEDIVAPIYPQKIGQNFFDKIMNNI